MHPIGPDIFVGTPPAPPYVERPTRGRTEASHAGVLPKKGTTPVGECRHVRSNVTIAFRTLPNHHHLFTQIWLE